eukprot:TRINITY_DN41929_c0_g1_i2.p1 TRINITY_DN41929_c0_g1~~TRINITY_DN41929_c0_g1_i2.p1  ORF type:complete len:588 (+),score=158.95 TRINITY_DN41929_c0_g1_i2:129-1892(+)
MQELSLLEPAPPPGTRHDFVDVMWQIGEKRSCDEVLIRYDCGHAMKAEVLVPVLPRTREYSNEEADRRRFLQHSMFVLTKNPGSPKVQITVPEGRCRACGRGQRQVLTCGLLQLDLSEASAGGAKAGALRAGALGAQAAFTSGRRLELPLSSHVFLAAMGQVCRLPDNVAPPPLLQNTSAAGRTLRPFDGPPLSREALQPWSRKDVEDEVKADVVKYADRMAILLWLLAIECIYLCAVRFGHTVVDEPPSFASAAIFTELRTLPALSQFELDASCPSWLLSALTVAVHKVFGPEASGKGGDLDASLMWSVFVHPTWILLSTLMGPYFWVLDLLLRLPKFFTTEALMATGRQFVIGPCSWFWTSTLDLYDALAWLSFSGAAIWQPAVVLSQMPLTNPTLVAAVLSVVVAALSAQHPPSLPLPVMGGVWEELPNFGISRSLKRLVSKSGSLGPLAQRLRGMWLRKRKEGRAQKGGAKGSPPPRGSKEGGQGKADKQQSHDGSGGRGRERSTSASSLPACFLCLDRPSRYILEPCGHRVVCCECAIQLVEAAARNRSTMEAGGSQHSSEKSGGACPSCGQSIGRAMRLFC